MKKTFAALLFVGLLSQPLTAAAPPYSSEAPIAYMKDLSSGAVLYDKGGRTRIPPASMAKMMTAHVAFRLIQRGELKLDTMFTVRPETWQRWHGPQAGSTMFLSAGEQVSVENLLHGIVTLSGNDACVVLAEGIAGTEQAFVAQNEEFTCGGPPRGSHVQQAESLRGIRAGGGDFPLGARAVLPRSQIVNSAAGHLDAKQGIGFPVHPLA